MKIVDYETQYGKSVLAVFNSRNDIFPREEIELLTHDLKSISTSAHQKIVALVDEQVIGYAALKFDAARKRWYLFWLAVAKDFQRKGVATKLLHFFVEFLKKKKVKRLFVETCSCDGEKPARAFYIQNLKKSHGSIVNLTFVYGFLGAAPVLAYTVAKGGIITLTKAMAKELAKELAPEIRVNAVAPSNVMTDMTKGAGEELIELFRQQTPLKRIADPTELAKPILFLASDDSSYITGEVLVVDGGYSLK